MSHAPVPAASRFEAIAEAIPYATSISLFDFTYNDLHQADTVALLDATEAMKLKLPEEEQPPTQSKVLKIIEGNCIPQAVIPQLAGLYALFRVPLLDPSEPPQLPKDVTTPGEKEVVRTIVIDKAELRQRRTLEVAVPIARGEVGDTAAAATAATTDTSAPQITSHQVAIPAFTLGGDHAVTIPLNLGVSGLTTSGPV